jgi:hypothetical protein
MTTGASYDTKERPSRPAKERGGPLRHPDVITLPSPTTTHTPGARHHHPSSPTASFAPPRIVTQVVVQQHYVDSAPAIGRALYRWRVNEMLEAADVGLRLADDGEDEGRLVTVTDEVRSELVRALVARPDQGAGDRVQHAISLFRRRDASEEDKRSACIALAGVLEERRDLLKHSLTSDDEGALFTIANKFAIRHRRADQSTAYDPVFLDWVFWAYLGTVELTNRLLSRPAP